MSILLNLKPAEVQQVRLLICWHFPYRHLAEVGWWSGNGSPVVRNYYATLFTDANDVARQVIPRLQDLRRRSIEFVHSAVQLDAPHSFKEAALFNLTALRSHTCFRLEDGTFVGFEGCSGTAGCCSGSCTHVWNYEQATLSLFPDLHRSMLESHLRPWRDSDRRASVPPELAGDQPHLAGCSRRRADGLHRTLLHAVPKGRRRMAEAVVPSH
jgi:non-lysosomal glucosylceramidase